MFRETSAREAMFRAANYSDELLGIWSLVGLGTVFWMTSFLIPSSSFFASHGVPSMKTAN